MGHFSEKGTQKFKCSKTKVTCAKYITGTASILTINKSECIIITQERQACPQQNIPYSLTNQNCQSTNMLYCLTLFTIYDVITTIHTVFFCTNYTYKAIVFSCKVSMTYFRFVTVTIIVCSLCFVARIDLHDKKQRNKQTTLVLSVTITNTHI